MIKLNASYSKKLPAESNFSSRSYHAGIEVEIPDGLTREQLEQRIHETFATVRESVERELHGSPSPANAALPLEAPPAQPPLSPPSGNHGRRNGYGGSNGNGNGQTDAPASPKQIKFLLDLARAGGLSPELIKNRFGVGMIEQLTRSQCSRMIDELNGKAA